MISVGVSAWFSACLCFVFVFVDLALLTSFSRFYHLAEHFAVLELSTNCSSEAVTRPRPSRCPWSNQSAALGFMPTQEGEDPVFFFRSCCLTAACNHVLFQLKNRKNKPDFQAKVKTSGNANHSQRKRPNSAQRIPLCSQSLTLL